MEWNDNFIKIPFLVKCIWWYSDVWTGVHENACGATVIMGSFV